MQTANAEKTTSLVMTRSSVRVRPFSLIFFMLNVAQMVEREKMSFRFCRRFIFEANAEMITSTCLKREKVSFQNLSLLSNFG
jgi:hypothetical protein